MTSTANTSMQMHSPGSPVDSVGESHATDTEQPTTLVNRVGEADLIPGLSCQELREAQLSDPNIGDVLRAR